MLGVLRARTEIAEMAIVNLLITRAYTDQTAIVPWMRQVDGQRLYSRLREYVVDSLTREEQ